MQAWRDIAKLAIEAAVFGICFAMLASVIGPGSPWLGLLLMFCFMGLAKVAEPLFMFRMPRALRAVDPRQVSEGIYGWLGSAASARSCGTRRFVTSTAPSIWPAESEASPG